ncbi:MAG: hypothetical protein CFE32_02305 [Alphaproteobacteria bacterium PA3]|nr:MAG: hypothetical protein CFE32_02305 [Alphaproteobacteria bacterium PA3]
MKFDPEQETASLLITNNGDSLVLQVYVQTAVPRPLRWQLQADLATNGSTSKTAQSGQTDGQQREPVCTAKFNASSTGAAKLSVFDGDNEIYFKAYDVGHTKAE